MVDNVTLFVKGHNEVVVTLSDVSLSWTVKQLRSLIGHSLGVYCDKDITSIVLSKDNHHNRMKTKGKRKDRIGKGNSNVSEVLSHEDGYLTLYQVGLPTNTTIHFDNCRSLVSKKRYDICKLVNSLLVSDRNGESEILDIMQSVMHCWDYTNQDVFVHYGRVSSYCFKLLKKLGFQPRNSALYLDFTQRGIANSKKYFFFVVACLDQYRIDDHNLFSHVSYEPPQRAPEIFQIQDDFRFEEGEMEFISGFYHVSERGSMSFHDENYDNFQFSGEEMEIVTGVANAPEMNEFLDQIYMREDEDRKDFVFEFASSSSSTNNTFEPLHCYDEEVSFGSYDIDVMDILLRSPTLPPTPNSQRKKERRRKRRERARIMLELENELDTDMDMSYERLVELENVSVGFNDDDIKKFPTQILSRDPSYYKLSECCICLEPYTVGDILMRLPCFHAFHHHCIDTWLRSSKKCPSDMSYISILE